MCLSLQNQQMTVSNWTQSLSQYLCPSEPHATGSSACETGKDWDNSARHPQGWVRKLSFQEFIYLVQTRQVGFYVKTKLKAVLTILKSLWKGQELELEVKDSNSETWWVSIGHSFLGFFIWITELITPSFQKLV